MCRETAGVKLRVELGPKEAQAGTAVIARAGEPGTVAQKTTVNVTVQLVKELKVALQEVSVGCMQPSTLQHTEPASLLPRLGCKFVRCTRRMQAISSTCITC